MAKRSVLHAAIFILILVCSPALSAPAAPRAPFWACSDGRGTVLLFWLPREGMWPEGGFLLERVAGKKKTVIAENLRPGMDEGAMSSTDPWDAIEIRILEEKIRYGTLTDEERNNSVSIMGNKAATDLNYGRALGVRFVDRSKVDGNIVYRLTSIAADGSHGEVVTSGEVNPMKRTPGPERPSGLRAEDRPEGVALDWEEPPAGNAPPVVAYRVGRGGPSGRSPALTKKPVDGKRRPGTGKPGFLDVEPPRETLVYQVQSVDLFARTSAPVKVKVERAETPQKIPSHPVENPVIVEEPLPSLSGAPPSPVPEDERSIMYRRALKDRDIGLPVASTPPREPRAVPSMTPPPAAAPDFPRTPDEEERIGIYRKMAEEGEHEPEIPAPPVSPAATPEKVPAPSLIGSSLPSPPPAAADFPRTREEEERIGIYRRMAEGGKIGPEVFHSLESGAASPEKEPPAPRVESPMPPASPASPAVSEHPRTEEEKERIETYRRMAEDRKSGPPSPVADPLRTPEEEKRIETYRRIAEGKETGPAVVPIPEPRAIPPEIDPTDPLPDADLPRTPEEEERIETYRRMAEDKERGIEEIPVTATAPVADAGYPPAPVIEVIRLREGLVAIDLSPGAPSCPGCEFLVLRSEAQGNPGVVQGRPLPPGTKHWIDTTVEPGKSYWYRAVAVDPDGRRSAPGVTRWMRVPDR